MRKGDITIELTDTKKILKLVRYCIKFYITSSLLNLIIQMNWTNSSNNSTDKLTEEEIQNLDSPIYFKGNSHF